MSGIMNMFVAAKTTIATAVDAFFNLTTLLLNTSSTNGAQNNTFLDSSTNNFTITRNGNTTQGTFTPFSQTGWSNYFDGTDDRLITSSALLAYSTGNASTQTATIEAMVYLNGYNASKAGADENAAIVAKGSVYMNFCINHTGNLILYHYDGSVRTPTSSGTVPLNTWTHVAVTLSGGVATFYINGSSSGTGTWYGLAATSDPVYIGEATGASASAINGYLSNLRISTTARTISVPTAPYTSDANTALLTCQSNRFVDNSSNGYAITVSTGTPSVQAFSPFAPTAAYNAAVVGGSAYFDGTGDYLTSASSANLAVGTGDFTYEFWLYPHAANADNCIFDTRAANNNTSGFAFLIRSSANLEIYTNTANLVCNGAIKQSMWQHVALVRSGSTVTAYVNGVSAGSATFSNNLTDQTLSIASYVGAGSSISAYISGFRLVKGTAVYTTTFTPPTSPATAITNTQILLSATNSGIFDSTAKNVLETVGNAQVSTTQAKWGTTSMAFDGTGDTLILQNSPIYDFGTDNFTIEGWVYVIALSGSAQETFIGRGVNAGASFHIALTTGGAWVYYLSSNNSTWNIASAVNIGTNSLNTWQHIALVRNGTTFTPYFNGVAGTTTTSSSAIYWNSGTSNVNQITVGGTEASTQVLNGYIDDLRITKGYARYTANFTPPTAAFPLQ